MVLQQLVVIVFSITCVTSAAETAFKFDGCYVEISEEDENGVSYNLTGTNLNADCAQFCGFDGYILAATKGDICRCTNLQPHPDTIRQSPYNVAADECNTNGDMVFLVDSSSSVGEENFAKVLHFMRGMLERADMIRSGDLRVAALSFSTQVNVHFHLSQHKRQKKIFKAIQDIPYIPGSTNTADALMTLTNEMFNSANGHQQGVPKLAIVITDGVSNLNHERTVLEAVRARRQGIHIFVIGIGMEDVTHEINAIASPPAEENRFLVRTFDELLHVRTQVFTRLCQMFVIESDPSLPYGHHVQLPPTGNLVCRTTCPAVVHTVGDRACEGDTCCGDVTRNAWSVYTVGGIDILSLIKKRINTAISKPQEMVWINEEQTEDCSDDFKRHPYPGPISLELESGDMKIVYGTSIRSVQDCQMQCLREGLGCRSISFTQSSRLCQLNRKSSTVAALLPVNTDTVLYDRLCTHDVTLLPTNFNLVMKDQDFTVKHFPAITKVPLHNSDFALDLTNSNAEDALTRSFETSVGESAVLSAESGFELERYSSERLSMEKSGEASKSESTRKEKSKEKKVGGSVNTEVGGGGFFVKVSVKAGLSGSIGTSSSSSSEQSGTMSRSISSSTNWEEEVNRATFYTSGYSRVLNSDKQTSMTYSLTVPPLHEGKIIFSREQRKSVVKLRSIFELNGYLKFSINGKEKEVHVSQVLRAHDRLFSTFTKMMFVRSVLSAKSTTKDRFGRVVE